MASTGGFLAPFSLNKLINIMSYLLNDKILIGNKTIKIKSLSQRLHQGRGTRFVRNLVTF